MSIGWKFHIYTSCCDSVLNLGFYLETVWTPMHGQSVYKFILSPDFNALLSGDVSFCINPFREKILSSDCFNSNLGRMSNG